MQLKSPTYLASHETLRHLHSNATDDVVSQMLSDLKHETHGVLLFGSLQSDIEGSLDVLTIEVEHLEGIQDTWELARGELNVDDGTDDLDHTSAQLFSGLFARRIS